MHFDAILVDERLQVLRVAVHRHAVVCRIGGFSCIFQDLLLLVRQRVVFVLVEDDFEELGSLMI